MDEISENEFEVIKEIIRSVRSVRAEMGLPQSTRVKVHIKTDGSIGSEKEGYIRLLGNVEEIEYVSTRPSKTATACIHDETEVYVNLGDLVDLEKEMKRISQRIEKFEKEIERLKARLSNKDFIKNAPESVVEETKEKLATLEERRSRIEGILQELKQDLS